MAGKVARNLTVELNGAKTEEGKPYNRFRVKDGPNKGETCLVDPDLMGLNRDLLGPCDKCAKSHPHWGYCGHELQKTISEFNNKTGERRPRRRQLVYKVRHGEADHNAWKKVHGKEWAEGPEFRRQPEFDYHGQERCIIDPPLTAYGREGAAGLVAIFKDLAARGFPMPKVIYVAPSHRTMETFEYGFSGFEFNPGDCYVLYDAREHETGNAGDILQKEYNSKDNPKLPLPHLEEYETDVDVERRASLVRAQICGRDDVDCIAIVTHSLLTRHSLRGLDLAGPGKSLLGRFMLKEAGIFACVIDSHRQPDETAKRLRQFKSLGELVKAKLGNSHLVDNLPGGMKILDLYRKTMGKRRLTEFPYSQARTTPRKVVRANSGTLPQNPGNPQQDARHLQQDARHLPQNKAASTIQRSEPQSSTGTTRRAEGSQKPAKINDNPRSVGAGSGTNKPGNGFTNIVKRKKPAPPSQ